VQALRQTFEAYAKEYCFLGLLLSAYLVVCWSYHLTIYTAWGLGSYLVLQLLGPILLNPHITSVIY
jgi:hypothetical protein